MTADRSRARLWLVGALLSLVVALVGLHMWAETSFTVHMVQHVMLVVVTAPLLALAAPLFVDRLPAPWPRFAASVRGPAWAAWAGVALLLQTVAMIAWHIPGPFEAAVRHEPLHGAEHIILLATAVLFWWVVLAAGPARVVMGVVAVFLAALTCSALGAALALAGHPWYASYRSLDDQAMGGVIMWSVAGVAYLVAALGLFFAWLARLEQSSPGGLVTSQ
jgi:putative membrane protein